MFSKTLLSFIFASFAAVKAVDLCAYSSTEGCSGSALCCFDAAEHLCCNEFTAEYGFAIGYTSLPGPVSDGQAWTGGNCVDGPIFTGETGTGDKCFVGGKTNSISWTNTAGKRANPGPNATAQPNVFKFTANGVEKAVKIPAGEGAVDAVIAHIQGWEFYWSGDICVCGVTVIRLQFLAGVSHSPICLDSSNSCGKYKSIFKDNKGVITWLSCKRLGYYPVADKRI
ncbi:hypothetical protein DFH06DRAFT_1133848 [Mycena polygramma]|nr:hypothetical protein DFH06DRAFT_1133848 [Mycena polygramma]